MNSGSVIGALGWLCIAVAAFLVLISFDAATISYFSESASLAFGGLLLIGLGSVVSDVRALRDHFAPKTQRAESDSLCGACGYTGTINADRDTCYRCGEPLAKAAQSAIDPLCRACGYDGPFNTFDRDRCYKCDEPLQMRHVEAVE